MKINFEIKNNKSNMIIFLLILSLFLFIINIFFHEDFILPKIDTLYNFRSVVNFINFDRPFSEFFYGSVQNFHNYDIFNYQSFLFDSIIFKGLNLNTSLKIFLFFKIVFKFFIILILFILVSKIFKSILYSLAFILLILCDASFIHVLHNYHHYLLLSLIITFSIIYLKPSKIKIVNSLIIGLFLGIGLLTIIYVGIVWGICSIIIAFYLLKKKEINTNELFFFFIGITCSIIIYLLQNYEEVLNFYKNHFYQIIDKNSYYLKYTIKYFMLNTYHLIFGNHGNNFLIIYLTIVYFKRDNFKKSFDKNIFNIIFIAIIFFLIIGTIIDPLHYYPSRLGILTPLIVYLLIIILKENQNINFLLEKKIYFSLIILLTASISKKIMDYEYNPNTLFNALFVLLIFFILMIFFYFLKKNKKSNIIALVSIAIFFTNFPHFNAQEISSFFSKKKNDEIKEEIKNITNKYYDDCIITNYPEYELFDNKNLYFISATNLQSNKKNYWGNNNCELIILIVNSNKNELNQFIKVNYNKNNLANLNFTKEHIVFYNNNFFDIISLNNNKYVSIYTLKKINKKTNFNKKIFYLNY